MFWKSNNNNNNNNNNEASENNIDKKDTNDKSPEKMFADVSRIRQKYPDKVPVVINVHQSSHADLPPLEKNKFIIPQAFTIAQLLATIRKRVNLSSEKALFIFTDNTIMPTSTTMIDILTENPEKEYLEFTIAVENTFGWDN